MNLSHGNFEEHAARVQRIREAANVAGSRVAIMIDTRGIEIRTGSERVARRLSMNWGVTAVQYTGEPGDRAKIEFAEKCVQELGYTQAGDSVIVTAGHTQLSGGTDMLRIIKL